MFTLELLSFHTNYHKRLNTIFSFKIKFYRDSVHNISVESFENVYIYKWPPGELELEDCIMKSLDQVIF